MKNFLHCKQEEGTATVDLSTLIKHLMPPQCSSHGSFERVNLEGSNVGAAMIGRRGSSGELHDCCSINIYINNNVQGVNNSVLVGSEVKMGDPGVSLSLRGVRLNNGNLETKKKRRDSNLGFCGMFLFLCIALFLLLALF